MTENQRMNEQELKQFCINLMEDAEICYLSTINEDNYPETRAVFNLRQVKEFPNLKDIFKKVNDSLTLFFATNTNSRKMEHIVKNPNSSAYYCIPKNFMGVYLSGKLEIITDNEIKRDFWQKGWDFYYRESTGDYMDSDYTILRLVPKKLRCWYKGKYELDF